MRYYKCMKLRLNPTVREINRYLSPVIENLLEKHKKVSNPDFENELKQITGIGYRQARNYKHHPKPLSRVNDNALIIPFVLNCRKQDQNRKYKLILFIFLGLILSILGFYKSYNLIFNQTIKVISVDKDNATFVSAKNLKSENLTLALNLAEYQVDFKLGQNSESIPNRNDYKCFNVLNTKHCEYTKSFEDSIIYTKYKALDGVVVGYSLSIQTKDTEEPKIIKKLESYLKSNKRYMKVWNDIKFRSENNHIKENPSQTESSTLTYSLFKNKSFFNIQLIDSVNLK